MCNKQTVLLAQLDSNLLKNFLTDAAVNGGLAKYQEAFFKSSSNNNLTNNSENSYSEKVVKLQSLMNEQIIILESGLVLHKKLASSDLLPLHR